MNKSKGRKNENNGQIKRRQQNEGKKKMGKEKRRIGLLPSKSVKFIVFVILSIQIGCSVPASELEQGELTDVYQVIPSSKPGAKAGGFSGSHEAGRKKVFTKKEDLKKLQPMSGEVKVKAGTQSKNIKGKCCFKVILGGTALQYQSLGYFFLTLKYVPKEIFLIWFYKIAKPECCDPLKGLEVRLIYFEG